MRDTLENMAFPIWFLPKRGQDHATAFRSLEGLGLYVEYYRPVSRKDIDLSKSWIILDNMGRELDISIEAGEVIKCRIPEFDAKDVGLGLIQLHANSAKELP
jgi:hypothetical protein